MSTPTTGINWTDATWNPIRGCSRVSAGCRNCYAEAVANRFKGPGLPYEGLVKVHPSGEPRWTGDVRFVEKDLDWPLRRRKPSRIFVNSMSDLFHERVTDEQIAAIFGVMAASPRHTFLVLTKRPERMRAWFAWIKEDAMRPGGGGDPPSACAFYALRTGYGTARSALFDVAIEPWHWPLPNVHLGVSVEDQATADERIPLLLRTPAAVRWVSAEPLLAPLDFDPLWLRPSPSSAFLSGIVKVGDAMAVGCVGLDWLVIGGESGPRARPCRVEWVRDIVRQCQDASVPVWVKQLGANPWADQSRCEEPANHWIHRIRHRSGEDIAEWPEDLRVRELPEAAHG